MVFIEKEDERMMSTYNEWKELASKPGTISTVMDISWLLKGCPKCGGTEWELTYDYHCYCCGCSKGYSTYEAWTNKPLAFYDRNGYHCFMCHGYGIRDEKLCDECGGEVTQTQEQQAVRRS